MAGHRLGQLGLAIIHGVAGPEPTLPLVENAPRERLDPKQIEEILKKQ